MDGELFSEYIGIPVQNVDSSFVGVGFTILPNKASGDVIRLHPDHVNPPFRLGPGQTTLLPLRITMDKRSTKGQCEGMHMRIEERREGEGRGEEGQERAIQMKREQGRESGEGE